MGLLKLFVDSLDVVNENSAETVPQKIPPEDASKTVEFEEKPAEDFLKQKMNDGTNTPVLDEKAPFVEEDPDDLFENGVRLWDSLPDEIVDQILMYTTKNSDEVLAMYHSLLRTCSRFHRIIKEKSHTILPRLYIRFHDDVMKKLPTMHDKIKVCVRMIVKEFGKCSRVTLALLGIMRSKRWRSMWLILHANPSFLPFWFSV